MGRKLKILEACDTEIVGAPIHGIEIIGVFDPCVLDRILEEISKYMAPNEVEINLEVRHSEIELA